MEFENDSSRIGAENYFSTPISNKSALNCYGNDDAVDYSGFNSDLNKYLNEKSISEMIKVSAEIKKFMRKFKLSMKVNMEILTNLTKNHLPQTRDIALGIAKYLPEEFRVTVNKKALVEATSLHDIAKVIMPEHIINKPGALDENERKIMNEHARLSYEMLKTTDLSKETLDLIKDHHHSHHCVECDNKIENINLQILSVADIYSALREKRCYKAELSKEKALQIIEQETHQGKFSNVVYEALVKYSQNEEKLDKVDSKWQIFNLKSVNSLCS